MHRSHAVEQAAGCPGHWFRERFAGRPRGRHRIGHGKLRQTNSQIRYQARL